MKNMNHPTTFTRRGGPASRLPVLIGLLSVLGFAGAAGAQGTSGALPDPISGRELNRYGERLGLSEQQRRGIDHFHEQYQEEFRVLREGPIETFMRDSNGMRSGLRLMQDRAGLEKVIRELGRLNSRIKSIDARLFDSVQTVLTDEQLAIMPHVRKARERQRYRSGMSRMVTFMNPAAQVDLGQLYADLDLTAEVREAADAMVLQYEDRLTVAVRKLYKHATDLPLAISKKLEEAGFNEQSLGDDQQRRQMFQAMGNAWREAQVDLMEKAAVISDLNRRTTKVLATVLPESQARRLRERYYEQGYADAAIGSSPVERKFEAALRIDGLSDALRVEITAARAGFRLDADRVEEQMIDLVDENRMTRTTFRSGRGNEGFNTRMDELRDRRLGLQNRAADSLDALLGPGLAERLERRLAGKGTSPKRAAGASPGAAVAAAPERPREAASGGAGLQTDLDPFLPGPITAPLVNRWGRQLGLDEDRQLILDNLHGDYLQKFRALEAGEIKAVREARRKVQPSASDVEPAAPVTPQMVERLYSLRRRALASIKALDDSFFRDLGVLLDDDAGASLRRIRLARKRVVFSRGEVEGSGWGRRERGQRGRGGRSWWTGRGEGSEHAIDLALIIDDLGLSEDDRKPLEPILLEYEEQAAGALEASFESNLKYQESIEKLTVESRTADGGERRYRGYRDVWEGPGRARREAREKVAQLNRQVLGRMTEVLATAAAEQLRVAYNRKAYREVYDDPQSAEPLLRASLELADLDTNQRELLGEAALTYRGVYHRLSERMVEATEAGRTSTTNPRGADWQRRADRRNTLDRLRYDRDELSEKFRRRIQTILSEEQHARIAGERETG